MRKLLTAAVTALAITGPLVGPPAIAATPQPGRYCQARDAYEVTGCDSAPRLPDSMVGTQLAWLVTRLGGRGAVSASQVRDHFSRAMLAVPGTSAGELVTAFRETHQRFGRFQFQGFSYPPRRRQAMALFGTRSGQRIEVPVSVSPRTGLINSMAVTEANPVLVARGRYTGWFDVAGKRMFLRCTGHGSPTVIFENGLTTDWYPLQEDLSATTRTCSYDPRRQNGPSSRSDSAPTPRTGNDRVRDLRGLLAAADVPGPYVLAAHSNGGLFSLMYASRHPGQVAGMVLIDAVHPDYHARLFKALRHLISESDWPSAEAQLCAVPSLQVDWERMDICRAEEQARAQLTAHPLSRMPLTVLSHGVAEGQPGVERDIVERVWAHLQQELAELMPGADHVIARRSGHDIQHTQPALVLRKIRQVVATVREQRGP